MSETSFVIAPWEAWETGVPLVLIGVSAGETAEKRRMDELAEAIIGPCNWNLAA